jgi:two-component system, LytTR family, response regulator
MIPSEDSFQLTLRSKNRLGMLLSFTFVGVILYQLITLQRTNHGELGMLLRGNVFDYVQRLLGYYVLFELISVFIFHKLTEWYFTLPWFHRFTPSFKNTLLLQLKFLPLILGSIFVFGPITNGIRYLVLHYLQYSLVEYFPEYFFTGQMFINYLLPFLIFGYGLLNINLFLDYNDWQQKRLQKPALSPTENAYLAHIEASDEQGETILSVKEVLWFEVENKNYFAYTQGKTYQIRKTLAELETDLNPERFFRINRAVMVNLAFVKNYSYWENDKYIVRMTDDKTEFVIQRLRLKDLKQRLTVSQQLPKE